MKVTNLEERIHIYENNSNALSILKLITESGVQEDAFYVMDIGDIICKHKEFKIAMPRVHPYYAVKCNDNLLVLEILAALGIGFDCASRGEINKVLSLGVEPNRIIFANPAKPASHITYSASQGVDLMTFDNDSELFKIKKLFPSAKLVIRIRSDDETAVCQLGLKFGCDFEKDAPRLLRLACTLGLDVVGCSFHVGSGCQNPSVFHRGIKQCRDIFNFAKTLGYTMTLLDIGGGFPGDKGTTILPIAKVVNEALNQFFPEDADIPVHVMAEPGRYYVSSAFTLACNIYSKREIKSENVGITNIMYYINDGTYGSFNCVLYDHYLPHPKVVKPNKNTQMYCSSIWGPTCDSMDKVVDSVYLPKLELGDWLYFENMGAYTLPVASPFNGFPIPKVHVVGDKSVWKLLKDILTLTEDHFAFGNTPQNIRLGLGKAEIVELSMQDLTQLNNEPIQIELPMQISSRTAAVNGECFENTFPEFNMSLSNEIQTS